MRRDTHTHTHTHTHTQIHTHKYRRQTTEEDRTGRVADTSTWETAMNISSRAHSCASRRRIDTSKNRKTKGHSSDSSAFQRQAREHGSSTSGGQCSRPRKGHAAAEACTLRCSRSSSLAETADFEVRPPFVRVSRRAKVWARRTSMKKLKDGFSVERASHPSPHRGEAHEHGRGGDGASR